MVSEDDTFFSRWSRRKAQVRSGEPVPAESGRPVPAVIPPVAAAQAVTTKTSSTTDPVSPMVPEVPEAEHPPLTLEDVKQLTADADFTPFVAREVAPEVRNAAFKKLFSDPKFNVMDGLDIYIDDYSQPDPLPVSLARKLMSAQTLGLFDEPKTEAPHTGVDANTPVRANLVSSSPEPVQPEIAGPVHPATAPSSTPDAQP